MCNKMITTQYQVLKIPILYNCMLIVVEKYYTIKLILVNRNLWLIVKVKMFDENDYHFVNQTQELLSLIQFVTNSFSRAVFSYKIFKGMHDDYSQELYEEYFFKLFFVLNI